MQAVFEEHHYFWPRIWLGKVLALAAYLFIVFLLYNAIVVAPSPGIVVIAVEIILLTLLTTNALGLRVHIPGLNSPNQLITYFAWLVLIVAFVIILSVVPVSLSK